MILSEKNAEPIIKKLLEYATETISKETGVRYDWQNISQELYDSEWIFTISIDNEKPCIDITEAMHQIDHIIKRYRRYAKQEREEI